MKYTIFILSSNINWNGRQGTDTGGTGEYRRIRENFKAQDQDVKLKFEFLQAFAFMFPLKKELSLVK